MNNRKTLYLSGSQKLLDYSWADSCRNGLNFIHNIFQQVSNTLKHTHTHNMKTEPIMGGFNFNKSLLRRDEKSRKKKLQTTEEIFNQQFLIVVYWRGVHSANAITTMRMCDLRPLTQPCSLGSTIHQRPYIYDHTLCDQHTTLIIELVNKWLCCACVCVYERPCSPPLQWSCESVWKLMPTTESSPTPNCLSL